MDATQTITIILALIGTILGVLNTLDHFLRKRVNLRVRPGQGVCVGGVAHLGKILSIEAVNLSDFPLTISDVGFIQQKTNNRLCCINPITNSGQSLPIRLESRESVVFYQPKSNIEPSEFASVNAAYVSTACGMVLKGKSPAIKEFAKECRKLVEQSRN